MKRVSLLLSEPDGFGVLAECLPHILRHRPLCRRAVAFPYHNRPIEGDAVRCGNEAGKPILHVVTQGRVQRELADLRTLGCTISVPLRVDRTVVEISATSCRVAPDLWGDRAGRSLYLPCNRADTCAPRAFQGYFLTFCEGKDGGPFTGRADAGPQPGARSRSRSVDRWTSLRTQPCASATKPSTKLFISKGAAR